MDVDPLEVARLDAQIKNAATIVETYFGKVMTEARHLDRIITYMEEWARQDPHPETVENIAYVLLYLKNIQEKLHILGTYAPQSSSSSPPP